MAFFPCASKNMKFQAVYLTTCGDANLSMSSFGFAPAQYTKWTIDNFSYSINTNGTSSQYYGLFSYHGDESDHLRLRSESSITAPAMSYNATTGVLSITAPRLYTYAGADAVTLSGGSRDTRTTRGTVATSLNIYLKAVF